MTITEKILRIKELGGSVSLWHINDSNPYGDALVLKIMPGWSTETVNEELDNKIKYLEDRPWLFYIDNKLPICDSCSNYDFVIRNEYEFVESMETYETCSKDHFYQIGKSKHEPITVCKDYTPLKIKEQIK